MGKFHVELKRVVDDSYEIEIGFGLMDKLVADLQGGLVKAAKFAVVTDSIVKELYAEPILKKLQEAGFKADLFAFPAGEKSKTRAVKEWVEDAMLEKGYRRDCCIIAVGGGVVTDLAGFVAGILIAVGWDRHMKKSNGLRFHIVEIKRACSGT